MVKPRVAAAPPLVGKLPLEWDPVEVGAPTFPKNNIAQTMANRRNVATNTGPWLRSSRG
jgi:hypothetical protein